MKYSNKAVLTLETWLSLHFRRHVPRALHCTEQLPLISVNLNVFRI